jgi:hypothetical protein
VDWIAVTPSEGTSSATVTFSVAPNSGPERQGSVQIEDRTFTILQGAAPLQCAREITPSSVTLGPNGGSGTVRVTTPTGCTWSAQTSVSWLTIVGPASGSGAASVSYVVQPNPGAPRTGTAQIAGEVFTVTQSNLDCASTIDPSSVSVGASGGSGTVAIQAPSGCAWSAETSVDWLTIIGPSAGSGPGAVSYAVQRNQGGARTGTARIAGQTFTVMQSPLDCTYTIAPMDASLPQGGGKGTVTITTQSGCAWTAQSLVDWIVINDVSAGPGRDSVTYVVAPNFGATRSGAMRIAGQLFTVNQAGCTYVVKPDRWDAPGAGGSQTVAVTSSPAGCAWTPTEREDWMTVTAISGSSGGTGEFTIRVDGFSSGTLTTRTGIVTVGTATVTVSQTSRFP